MATQIVNNIKDIEISLKRLGLWLFIVSDISFFVALVSSRFFIYGTNTPSEINQILGLSLTILLLASSLTAYRAEVASVNQNKKMVLRNLLITIIIGLIFLVGVAFEWYVALQHEITCPSKPFGTVLFTLTGVHAFHVFTGIIALIIVFYLTAFNKINSNNSWPVEGVVKWWHLVDVAWVAIYPTLYLLG